MTTRRTDAELSAYFGGRAGYLSTLSKQVAEAESRLNAGPTPEDAIGSDLGCATVEDWKAMIERQLSQLLDAMVANQ